MSGQDETRAVNAASLKPSRVLDPVPAFKYVTVPNASTYRAIMAVFFAAKQRYVIELNPREVLEQIWANGDVVRFDEEQPLEAYLDSLVDWGNLAFSHDAPRAASLKDYYRRRYVYRLTAVGEAAHKAVLAVEATVGRTGSLQTSMLERIRDALRGLVLQQGREHPDASELVHLLHSLHAAFTSLTEEASLFVTELNRHLNAERYDVERFQLYKHAVLAYISRFVQHLRRVEHELVENLSRVRAREMERLLRCAVAAAELPPALEGEDPEERWIAEQRKRWHGVLTWFEGRGNGEARWTDRLAGVAVDAVVRVAQTLARLNERRTQRIDRVADFRRLARWFSTLETDEDAHRLFHATFGVYASRHFHLGDDDVELVHPSTSWWEATPAPVPVPLRRRGRVSNAGRSSPAPDHSASRRWIEQRRRRERAQLDAARRRFLDHGRLRLSDVATLDKSEFSLLLALLDEALCAPRREDGARATRTSDGRLIITLYPLADTDGMVELVTPTGRLRCRDYTIEVRDAQRPARSREVRS